MNQSETYRRGLRSVQVCGFRIRWGTDFFEVNGPGREALGALSREIEIMERRLEDLREARAVLRAHYREVFR
jgi:hypothetical protein